MAHSRADTDAAGDGGAAKQNKRNASKIATKTTSGWWPDALATAGGLAAAGAVLRAALLAVAAVQDTHPVVKYTDIDYAVFSDAASLVAAGSSPYARDTYRYTPLLAFMLIPSVAVHPLLGKLLFCACDLVAGTCIFVVLRQSPKLRSRPHTAAAYAALWTLNPFVAVISTRGSAESVVAVLVLATLWAIVAARRQHLAAILFGIAVHFKIFPIIYAIPIWFGLDFALSTSAKKFELRMFSRNRIVFGLVAGSTFLGLTAAMFYLYGNEFLDATYLYHIHRKDHRHNFSIYFYKMYLGYNQPRTGSGLSGIMDALISFVPQLGIVAWLGVAFAHDLPFAWFAQTFAFVTFNKVCTSQYFMWYITLLPLILPYSRLASDRWRTGVALVVAWVLGQALWLSQAFRLEHLGENTFRNLWGASALFFMINVEILRQCMVNQTPIQ